MRILFIAPANSIHLVRWMGQLDGTGWDLHLFPAVWPDTIHGEFRNLTLHGVGLWRPAGLDPSVRVAGTWPFRKGAFRVSQWMNRLASGLMRRERVLARTIRRLNPDVIHTLEMQRGGYLTFGAQRILGQRFPPWIFSCWGNDLYFFGRQPDHADRIREVMGACDYFMADCERDLKLAPEYGFRGESLGYFPGPGGFRLDDMMRRRSSGSVAGRRMIAVKGYQHWGGRALVALAALHRCSDVLGEYEIAVYSATPEVEAVVSHMAMTTPLRIRVLPRSSHDEVVRIMGKSRLAIGNSITDGTPNTMLEAMVMGAFPIQSDTISTAEWIEDGRNGFLAQPEDVRSVEQAIRRALADDRLMETAAAHNTLLTRQRIDWSVVRPRVLAAYERVAARGALERRERQGEGLERTGQAKS